MHIPGVGSLLMGGQFRDDFDLPDYPALFANPWKAPK